MLQPRSLHHQHRPILDNRAKAKEGPPEDRVAADSGERNELDGKDLEQHSSQDKGLESLCGGIRSLPCTSPSQCYGILY